MNDVRGLLVGEFDLAVDEIVKPDGHSVDVSDSRSGFPFELLLMPS